MKAEKIIEIEPTHLQPHPQNPRPTIDVENTAELTDETTVASEASTVPLARRGALTCTRCKGEGYLPLVNVRRATCPKCSGAGAVAIDVRRLRVAILPEELEVDPEKPCGLCGGCDLAKFRDWRARIEKGLGFDNESDQDGPRFKLIDEIHADNAARFPLGIAVRLGEVISGLACSDRHGDEGAIELLLVLAQDEEDSARLNGADEVGDESEWCEPSRPLAIARRDAEANDA
jgi:hypothetical protein